MIRTTISICALLGGLLLLSLAIRESKADEPATTGANEGPQLNSPLTGDQDESIPTRVAARTDERRRSETARELADGDEIELATEEQLEETHDRIQRCLTYYFGRPENASSRSPWGVMHALIAYGVDTEIYAQNRKVNAIGWLCWNGSCRGQRLLYTQNGRIAARQGPGVQGHHGQFLAMLAQSRVGADFELRVDGKSFTVADLIEYEKETCVPKSELTFKLIALSHYLDLDETWVNRHGQWSIERLIQEELAQPIVGAACGGTHRMMGFSYAVRNREAERGEMTGQWARAKKFVDAYHDYTFKLQNRDGSFSTKWFEGRGADGDSQRRVRTTGHILEWLVYSLPKYQLRDVRVVRAVDHLSNLMLDERGTSWEIGPKGHALHALALYDQRVFDAQLGEGTYRIARDDRDEKE